MWVYVTQEGFLASVPTERGLWIRTSTCLADTVDHLVQHFGRVRLQPHRSFRLGQQRAVVVTPHSLDAHVRATWPNLLQLLVHLSKGFRVRLVGRTLRGLVRLTQNWGSRL